MFGINRLTVGFGMGHDFLTDRDKDIWIYQHKQWYGLNQHQFKTRTNTYINGIAQLHQ